MKSNRNRRKEIFEGVLPIHGTREYYAAIEALRKREQEAPGIKEFSKKSWEKVTRSLEAQSLSNCDLITENTLRHFLTEFNTRTWRFGLRSMPIMFNIMEAYFNYRKPEIYFELIEEENYLISFFDFIDFVTSKDFQDNKKLIEENLTCDLIYNFNVGKDLKEIKFKTQSGDEFIVAGISIIRRGGEITVTVITGRKKTDENPIDKNSIRLITDNPNKTELMTDVKESLKNKEIEYEYIDEEKEFIKVIVACRLDLDTMTIDARYVAEETNVMFNLVTDEVDGFLNSKGEFLNESLKDTYFKGKEKIEEFSAIFEVVKLSLYLPYFFNLNEDLIVEEVLETRFKSVYSSPLTKRKYSDVFGYKSSAKSLYSLDSNNIFSPDTIKLRDDLFKIQSSGYWKKIPLDQIGLDKRGQPIHGKTWVNQNLSWFEAKEEDLIIEKNSDLFTGANSGYIYILRNPAMEKNIFKIGLTRNKVNDRAEQLSKTSVPDKFYKSQEWNVKDCVRAEKEIHSRLNNFRIDPRREFFKIEYDYAIKTIKEVVDQINRE